MIPNPKRLRITSRTLLVMLVAPACAKAQHEAAPNEAAPQPLPPVPMLSTQALAGQTVAVLPITLVVADPAIQSDSGYAPYRDRRAALHRTDSLISEALLARGPEVHWVLPPELRKMARRSAGFVPEPEEMGQAVLRSPNMSTIPDPLRSSLRSLVAVADGRLVLVPAALGFGPEPDGRIRADLSIVMGDARNGKVLWRSLALGRGKSPDEALNAALAAVLPGP
ncbi:MAG TPA: hypothetical protein VGN76_15545 [Gemmatimonadales bacterium]|jgi:hypothetical protein|nr:hypothetical protein [Gemmatimonadales bacterium]